MSIFIGLGIGIGTGLPLLPRAHLALGFCGAFSVAAIFVLLYAVEPSAKRAAPVSRPFDPDDIMLVLPLVIWCGGAGGSVRASWLVAAVVAVGVGAMTLMRRDGAATPTAPPGRDAARRITSRS